MLRKNYSHSKIHRHRIEYMLIESIPQYILILAGEIYAKLNNLTEILIGLNILYIDKDRKNVFKSHSYPLHDTQTFCLSIKDLYIQSEDQYRANYIEDCRIIITISLRLKNYQSYRNRQNFQDFHHVRVLTKIRDEDFLSNLVLCTTLRRTYTSF